MILGSIPIWSCSRLNEHADLHYSMLKAQACAKRDLIRVERKPSLENFRFSALTTAIKIDANRAERGSSRGPPDFVFYEPHDAGVNRAHSVRWKLESQWYLTSRKKAVV